MQIVAFDKAQSEKKAAGLAGWIMAALSNLRATGAKKSSERQLKLVERLAVGPKKELLLVRCGGDLFLVGTGADSVQSIVRVTPVVPEELAR